MNIITLGSYFFRYPITIGNDIKTTKGNGLVAGTGNKAIEYGDGVVHKTKIVMNTTLTHADTGGSGGYSSQKIYDFPAGNIIILGATVKLVGLAGSGGIADAADGDVALGTAACNAGSLTGTEVDILPSTTIAQFAAGTGPITGSSTDISVHDGTGTAKDLYLNIIFDDADSSATDTLKITGDVYIVWVNLGDY